MQSVSGWRLGYQRIFPTDSYYYFCYPNDYFVIPFLHRVRHGKSVSHPPSLSCILSYDKRLHIHRPFFYYVHNLSTSLTEIMSMKMTTMEHGRVNQGGEIMVSQMWINSILWDGRWSMTKAIKKLSLSSCVRRSLRIWVDWVVSGRKWNTKRRIVRGNGKEVIHNEHLYREWSGASGDGGGAWLTDWLSWD